MFSNGVLMITGGTGSFGNAVLQRFLDTDVREIRIFSRDEKKQEDMRIALSHPKLKFYIGDVRDYAAVDDVMHGVDYVFHAAALKQVPSCEFYPMEAIRTNALGAENVMRAAIDHHVSRCVLLSTDKAVYPINAMGMSKALMEKVMVAKARLSKANGTVSTSPARTTSQMIIVRRRSHRSTSTPASGRARGRVPGGSPCRPCAPSTGQLRAEMIRQRRVAHQALRARPCRACSVPPRRRSSRR